MQFNKLSEEIQALQKQIDELCALIKVIHSSVEQGNAAKQQGFLRSKIDRIKNFLTPRIGAFMQYGGRQYIVPKKYYHHQHVANPLTISIVTPSYNQGKFIERTILSVLHQDYPCLEYIIQDGNSKDDTVAIIKRYQSSLKSWQSAKDNGQASAINLGFSHATGEIMAFLNSDDLLLPGTLHYVAQYFSTHPEVDVVYGHRVMINEQDLEIGRWILPGHDSNVMIWRDYIPQETLFWRKRIWEKVGGKIDESFQFAMDWDLLLRFRDAGAKFVRLPRFLGAFRLHTTQKTTAISNIGEEEMMRLRHRCHGHPLSYIDINKNTRAYLIKHVIINKLYRAGILRY